MLPRNRCWATSHIVVDYILLLHTTLSGDKSALAYIMALLLVALVIKIYAFRYRLGVQDIWWNSQNSYGSIALDPVAFIDFNIIIILALAEMS